MDLDIFRCQSHWPFSSFIILQLLSPLISDVSVDFVHYKHADKQQLMYSWHCVYLRCIHKWEKTKPKVFSNVRGVNEADQTHTQTHRAHERRQTFPTWKSHTCKTCPVGLLKFSEIKHFRLKKMHKGNLTDLFNYLEKRGKRQVLQSEPVSPDAAPCLISVSLSWQKTSWNKSEGLSKLLTPFCPTARKKSFQVSEIVIKTSVAIHLTQAVDSTV